MNPLRRQSSPKPISTPTHKQYKVKLHNSSKRYSRVQVRTEGDLPTLLEEVEELKEELIRVCDEKSVQRFYPEAIIESVRCLRLDQQVCVFREELSLVMREYSDYHLILGAAKERHQAVQQLIMKVATVDASKKLTLKQLVSFCRLLSRIRVLTV